MRISRFPMKTRTESKNETGKVHCVHEKISLIVAPRLICLQLVFKYLDFRKTHPSHVVDLDDEKHSTFR